MISDYVFMKILQIKKQELLSFIFDSILYREVSLFTCKNLSNKKYLEKQWG